MLLQLSQLSPELLLCHAGLGSSQLLLCRVMCSHQLNCLSWKIVQSPKVNNPDMQFQL